METRVSMSLGMMVRMSHLYLLNIKQGPKGHNIAQGFVIRATSPKEARKLAAQQSGDEGTDTWLRADLSSCNALRIVGKSEVILRDFLGG